VNVFAVVRNAAGAVTAPGDLLRRPRLDHLSINAPNALIQETVRAYYTG
jgi:hypothetical protein